MSIVSKMTVTPLLYLSGALFLALVGVSVAFYATNAGNERDLAVQTSAKEILAGDNARMKLRIDELEGANKATGDANTELARKLAEQAGKAQDTARLLADAVAERDRNARARDRALDNLQRSRENTYATDPDCAAWAAMPVCGAISDSLRLQWRDAGAVPASEGSSDRGEGEAADPDRGDVDRGSAAAAATDASASTLSEVPEGLLLQSTAGSGALGSLAMGEWPGRQPPFDPQGRRGGD